MFDKFDEKVKQIFHFFAKKERHFMFAQYGPNKLQSRVRGFGINVSIYNTRIISVISEVFVYKYLPYYLDWWHLKRVKVTT